MDKIILMHRGAAVALVGLAGLLSGCAAPSAFQLASYAADGVSYSMTDKSVTDHLISEVSAKDCALGRMFDGEDICKDKLVERYPDGTPVPSAREASKSIVSAENDEVFQNFAITNADPDDDEAMTEGGYQSDANLVVVRPGATGEHMPGLTPATAPQKKSAGISVAALNPQASPGIDPQVRAHAAPVEPVYADDSVATPGQAEPPSVSESPAPDALPADASGDVGSDINVLEDDPDTQSGPHATQGQGQSSRGLEMGEDADEVLDFTKIDPSAQNDPQ